MRRAILKRVCKISNMHELNINVQRGRGRAGGKCSVYHGKAPGGLKGNAVVQTGSNECIFFSFTAFSREDVPVFGTEMKESGP